MSATCATPRLYTKAEIARHFHLPESTIRYYCERYAPFLPCEGTGRSRRYAASCLEVLAHVREMLPKVRTSRAMERLLAERFPRVEAAGGQSRALPDATADGQESGESTIPLRFELCRPPENPVLREQDLPETAMTVLRLLERQEEVLESMAETLARLAEHQRETNDLRARANAADARLTELHHEARTLRVLLDSVEKIQRQDTDQLRKWLGKLAKEQKKQEPANSPFRRSGTDDKKSQEK